MYMTENLISKQITKLQLDLESKIASGNKQLNDRMTKLEVAGVEVKKDVEVLKEDVSVLKEDVGTLKKSFRSLDERTHKMGVQFDAFGDKLDMTLEIVLSIQEEQKTFNKSRLQIDDHEHRISAVEHFVRKHPN